MKEPNNTAILKCAYCGSTRVRKSTPQGLVEQIFLRFRRLHPFHCVDCYKRFYSRSQMIRVEHHEPEIVSRAPEPAQVQRTEEKKPSARSNHEERRCFSRLDCQIPARIVAGSSYRVTGTVNSISLNGCFIETPQAAPAGSEIELMLDIGEGTRLRALVRSSLATIGVGVEFTNMTVPNFRRLRSIARDSVRLLADL